MTGILDPRIPKVFVCGILITSLPEHCRNNRRFHKQIAVILIAGKISPSLHRAHWVLFAICRYQPIKLPSVRTEHGFSCKIFGYSQGVRWFMKRINLISSSEELHMSIMPSFALYCFAYTPGASVFFCFFSRTIRSGSRGHVIEQASRVRPGQKVVQELCNVLLTILSHCFILTKLKTAEFVSQM